ncbi:DUF947-domain-containing protein [Martensiomyces pterosporus]|nr:DUF947-domain-containing protein [Martensiomyces pterosporus]
MPKPGTKVMQYSSDEENSGDSAAEFSQIEDSDSEEQQYTMDSNSGEYTSESEDEAEESAKSKEEKIRQQLADVPFSQLIRIQQQMGTQKFNKTMGIKGKSQTKEEVKRALKKQLSQGDSEEPSSESDDSGPETIVSKRGAKGASGSSSKKGMARDSRKMPTIVSSKRPVSRFRQVVDAPKAQSRDPRFDSLSGNLNEDLFEKSYAFLEKQQHEEIELLKGQAKKLKEKNPEEARRIQLAVSSMQSKIAAKNHKKHIQELKRTHRKKDMEAVKQGKMPYYLKKRDIKTLEIAEKFTKLKDSSKLDSFLEKRRKRNATKEHRNMPYRKRED